MVEPERIKQLSNAPETAGDYVLYWMQQSQRAVHNPALEVAVTAANRLGLPVVVVFGLTTEGAGMVGHPGGELSGPAASE
jgi:deoxyribodipyrimidine photo-lyase